jgi:hypothetical protein
MRSWKKVVLGLSAAVVLAAGAGSAQAHHSAAGVDMSKTLTVVGTLKEFDYSAPHALFTVVSMDENGHEVETKCATISPVGLVRQGFRPKDFVPGDKVEVTYNPNRVGGGGLMVTLKLSDGRVVKGNQY